MGSPSSSNDETGCLPIHKLLTAVALVVCVGGVLIGSGEGGNPCYLKKDGGAAYPAHCGRGPETDTCCKTDSCTECVQVSMPMLTLAGIGIMCVAIFMLLLIPLMCYMDRKRTLTIEDLDKNPQKIDKFRRSSLEAKRASLNSQQMHAAAQAAATPEPGMQRRGSKLVVQNQEVVINPVAAPDGV